MIAATFRSIWFLLPIVPLHRHLNMFFNPYEFSEFHAVEIPTFICFTVQVLELMIGTFLACHVSTPIIPDCIANTLHSLWILCNILQPLCCYVLKLVLNLSVNSGACIWRWCASKFTHTRSNIVCLMLMPVHTGIQCCDSLLRGWILVAPILYCGTARILPRYNE
jgi:hypothetical protein